jgi:hypothetical protein
VDSAGFSPLVSIWSTVAVIYSVCCVLFVESALFQILCFYSIFLFNSQLIVIAMAPEGNLQKEEEWEIRNPSDKAGYC